MLRIDNFLIVFSLEVGGKFIGWFGLITNALVLPLCVVMLIAVSIDKDLQYISEQLDEMDVKIFDVKDERAVKQLREYLIISCILVIIISSIYLIASVLLIRGTKSVRAKFRNPFRVKIFSMLF